MLLRNAIATAAAALALSAGSAAADTPWSGPVPVPGHSGLNVPQLGMDAAGEAVLEWSDGGGGIYASIRSPSGRFSSPQILAAGPDGYAVRAERLAVGADGTAVVVWARAAKHTPHYRIMAAVRRPHGRFGPARLVGAADSVFSSTPCAAVDRHGTIVVAWSRASAPQLAVAPPGRRFGAPRTMRDWGTQVTIAFTPAGRLYAAFADWRLIELGPVGAPIYATSATARLRFGPFRNVSRAPGRDPVLAAGPSGSMTLAWRAGLPDTSEGFGLGAIWTATATGGGHFGAPAVASPAGIVGREPVLAGAPAGVLLTWDRWDGGSPDHTASGLVSTWLVGRGRGPWAAAQPLAAPGDWTSNPGMAIDGQGTATAAYMRRTSDTERTLVVRTGPAGGALGGETVLATVQGPPYAHNAWWQAAVAASGGTTVIVWAPIGSGLVAFSRTSPATG